VVDIELTKKILYTFFWVFPRRQMDLTEGSETSAQLILTPGKYPKENIQDSEHGENLKSRKKILFLPISEAYRQHKQII
jgi:hypothetical protein